MGDLDTTWLHQRVYALERDCAAKDAEIARLNDQLKRTQGYMADALGRKDAEIAALRERMERADQMLAEWIGVYNEGFNPVPSLLEQAQSILRAGGIK